MVNPGHPSRSCANCRFRRIKCDEARPTCRKCTTSKRVCLGYTYQEQRGLHSSTRSRKPRLELPALSPSSINRLKKDTDAAGSMSDVIDVHEHASNGDVVDTGDTATFMNLLSIAQIDVQSDPTLTCVIDTMEACFQSLRQSAQTVEAHRTLQQRYSSAIRELRESLTSFPNPRTSCISSYMFSLYEMLVSLDTTDRTWQLHLEGFLIMLQQGQKTCRANEGYTLSRAVQLLHSMDATELSISSLAMNDVEKAALLLDMAKLRLRGLVSEMKGLASADRHPRKLDMQKLRTSLKQVHRDIVMIPSLLSTASFTSINPKYDEFGSLVIITASLLITSGEYLQSKERYKNTQEHFRLNRSIQESVDGILASATFLFPEGNGISSDTSHFIPRQPKLWDALRVMWPLYCASQARDATKSQQETLQNTLWRIGVEIHIPKALSLGTPTQTTPDFSDTLDGLIIVGAVVSS